jgi:hypothetical protein
MSADQHPDLIAQRPTRYGQAEIDSSSIHLTVTQPSRDLYNADTLGKLRPACLLATAARRGEFPFEDC